MSWKHRPGDPVNLLSQTSVLCILASSSSSSSSSSLSLVSSPALSFYLLFFYLPSLCFSSSFSGSDCLVIAVPSLSLCPLVPPLLPCSSRFPNIFPSVISYRFLFLILYISFNSSRPFQLLLIPSFLSFPATSRFSLSQYFFFIYFLLVFSSLCPSFPLRPLFLSHSFPPHLALPSRR